MPDWSERKEAIQAQGYRCRQSEEPPEHAAPTVAKPIRPDRPKPVLGPKTQHAAMLVEDSLGCTASSTSPHRRRASGTGRNTAPPCAPVEDPPSPKNLHQAAPRHPSRCLCRRGHRYPRRIRAAAAARGEGVKALEGGGGGVEGPTEPLGRDELNFLS
jgi:hypothetical protein